MPYSIRKVGKKFQVVNTETGEVHAKGTTKKKAEAQIRLLGSKEGGKVETKPRSFKRPSQPVVRQTERRIATLERWSEQVAVDIDEANHRRNMEENLINVLQPRVDEMSRNQNRLRNRLRNLQRSDAPEDVWIPVLDQVENDLEEIGEMNTRMVEAERRINEIDDEIEEYIRGWNDITTEHRNLQNLLEHLRDTIGNEYGEFEHEENDHEEGAGMPRRFK